ncbi:MAG: Rne/Rng family ribonuclease [Deltaproteobacteria bacterium]|nr:Rne/Rng family ribonuclease [Deltaproteobacteria bacterium]MBN2846527.1 Rne/Rng family ribonuclease [Deltaproteobacteria bacterium]
MTKKMLVNTIDEEESRMAIIEDGSLIEFTIKMSVREPTIGNIYKGIIRNVRKGLQAAFVDYGDGKTGFLPLRDVDREYFEKDGKLSTGKEVLAQVVREAKGSKGAMLTTQLSLPGRYLVLMPNKRNGGISRKIGDETDRKRLKDLMEQVIKDGEMGFIVRTAGMNRTKQELHRDYQMLLRLWNELRKKAEKTPAPALIYEESDFAVRSFRDYYTSDISEVFVDDIETLRKMKVYCKAVSPRNVRMIKQYRDEIPIFDKYNIEDQISEIYQERVNLKSGGYIIISPTEALITIDVNSGRASGRKDVEETAFKTNIEAAGEIARQLRLRDLGGLIVIDFIDMKDRKNILEVEKTFKNALSVDRSRIQLSKISKFGILELSRQKKQSTIQEISYTTCPHCRGSGLRPTIEYMALSAFRKIKSRIAQESLASIIVTLPNEVSHYLLNQKRSELSKLEDLHNVSINISGDPDMLWGESDFELVKREIAVPEPMAETIEKEEPPLEQEEKPPKKPLRRRGPRRRRPKAAAKPEQGKQGVAVPPPAVDAKKEEVKEEPRASNDSKEKKGIIDKFYKFFKD